MCRRETTDWLRAFLDRRGLTEPDDRALYRYRCSEGEYAELGRLLRLIPDFADMVRETRICGALVLAIAEWSRRERQFHHQWEWEPIYQAFGLDLNPVLRGQVIVNGLEGFWGRPVHRFQAGHRDFLGSLVSEGGLPFQVLRAPNNPLHTLFARLLRKADQADSLGADMEALVRREVEAAPLPQVFSSVGPVRLIAGMTEQLRFLVSVHGLDSASDPVEFLSEHDPQWRERFPIPLDQDLGTEFLNSLLQTASDEGRRWRRTGALCCKHIWQEGKADGLVSLVVVPAEVTVPLAHAPTSSRLEVEILEGTEPRLRMGAAFADLGQPGHARLRMRSGERTIKRQSPTRSLFLVVSAGGLQVGRIEIPDSAIPLGEVPVGLARGEEVWRVCGQASFRTEDQDVLVVVPEGVSLQAVEPQDAKVQPEATPFDSEGYRVRGQTTVTLVGDDRYLVRTGHEGGAASGLALSGDLLEWPTSPSFCVLGMPRIAGDGNNGAADVTGLRAYIGGCRVEDLDRHDMTGVRFVSVRNAAGETLLRRKVAILPADFQIDLTGSHEPGQGWIRVTSAQRCLVEVSDDRLEVQRTRDGNATSLHLRAHGEIPAEVLMRVTPSLVSDPVEIRLPFPYVGCMTQDRHGRPLAKDLSIDNLLGARLMLYGMPGHPGFAVTLSLAGYNRGQLYDRWTYRATQRPLEISLYGLHERMVDLLSVDTSIDCEVRLEVEGGPAPLRRNIRLFGAQLRQTAGDELCLISQHMPGESGSEDSADTAKPRLMLLHDPSMPSVPLKPVCSEGVVTGGFQLPFQVERDGPWLVVPGPGSAVSFRPVFVPGQPDPEVNLENVESLQKAVQAFRPDSAVSSFVRVLDAMGENPRHGGWEFLKALYRNFGYLPLTTFEVWKALVRHPRALCMAMFKFEMDETFVCRLERDFPLFFEMLPVQEFRAVTERFRGFLLEQGIPQETADTVLNGILGRLETATVAYGTELQQWLSTGYVDAQARQARLVLPMLFERVIRERVEGEWPDYGAHTLAKWIGGQSDHLAGGLNPELRHRKAVAYLPAFVAAVALGEARVDELFDHSEEALFHFRRIRDFDANWFRIAFNAALFARL